MIDLDKPIVAAPVGYVVNLENPQRRGEAVLVWVGVVGLVIATILLMIRAYTKLVFVKKVASDDCKFITPGRVGLGESDTIIRVYIACVGR